MNTGADQAALYVVPLGIVFIRLHVRIFVAVFENILKLDCKCDVLIYSLS